MSNVNEEIGGAFLELANETRKKIEQLVDSIGISREDVRNQFNSAIRERMERHGRSVPEGLFHVSATPPPPETANDRCVLYIGFAMATSDIAYNHSLRDGDLRDFVELMISASEYVRQAQAIADEAEINFYDQKKAKSEYARNNAYKRHENSVQQRDKKLVNSCWLEWQKKPENYKGKAAFARDMLTKCDELTSQKVIEDWCRVWEKENRNPAS